jgi:organic radical activating enzyme
MLLINAGQIFAAMTDCIGCLMKKQNESYQEYKKRVIDPISKSFCGAKWYNASVWLGHGATTSCHHPPAHKIPLDELKNNPSALHNTVHKKTMRALMLKGERPPECEYCWKIEDINKDHVSDRTLKTVIYPDELLQEAQSTHPSKDVNLRTLEIAFERTCNFACSYCNAGFSSRWGQDIKQNGPYQNLFTDGAAAYQHQGNWAEIYKKGEANPYVEAFWKWWPELSQTLQELRVTGGEPLMSDDVWKLFDYFKENGSPEQMTFSINSNLGAKSDLIDKLIEKSHYVKNFQLYTSCETTSTHAEYIRDGLNYEQYKINILKICKEANLQSLNMMMTINSLCLFQITDFLDWMMEVKSTFGRMFPVFTLNILRFPSFMSPLALPDQIKQECQLKLKEWVEKNKTSPLVHEVELAGLYRLIDYLDVVKTPHHQATLSQNDLWTDFKSFYTQYDQRRNKNFLLTFPQLADWYNLIPEKKSIWPQHLVGGDATVGFHNTDWVKAEAKKAGII